MKKFAVAVFLGIVTVFSLSAAGPTTILGKLKQKGEVQASLGNLKQLMLAMLMYSADNRNYLPDAPGADGLTKLKTHGDYLTTKILIAPYDTARRPATGGVIREENTSYLYLGNAIGNLAKLKAPSMVPLMMEKPEIRGGNEALIGFADGHVVLKRVGDASSVAGIIKSLRSEAAGSENEEVWEKLLKAAAELDAK